MHEMALAADLSRTVQEYAADRKLTKVVFAVGSFSGVSAEAFQFCAETVFRETYGPQVLIELVMRDGQMQCVYGEIYASNNLLDPCPSCGSFEREITDGKDLILENIEVEDKPAGQAGI